MIPRLALPGFGFLSGGRTALVVGGAALLNVAAAAALVGRPPLAATALVGGALLAAAAAVPHRAGLIALAALGTTLVVPLPFLGDPVPGTGGAQVFPPDLLVLAAIAAASIRSVGRDERRSSRAMPRALALPFLLLIPGVALAVLRGHTRYGESLVSQPLRLLAYAAIGGALVGVGTRMLYRGIVAVFYFGVVLEAGIGAVFLVTGRSQTDQTDLSTGGFRVLALGTAIYLCGGLLLALINLEGDTAPKRRILHLVVAALAVFGIAIAYGRANFAALAVVVPAVLLLRRRIFGVLASYAPLIIPCAVVAGLLLMLAAPRVVPTLGKRLFSTSGSDLNVVWREVAAKATLQGYSKDPVRGMGFGRSVTFSIQDQKLQTHTYTIAGDPHNSYVWLLAGGGLLVIVPLALLFLGYVYDTIRRIRRLDGVARTLAIWALAFWFVFVVNAFAGPVLSRPDFLLTIWTLMLIPAAVSPSGEGRHPVGRWRGADRADLM